MDYNQSPQNEAPFSKFQDFVGQNSVEGQAAQGNSARYVPLEKLRQYWGQEGRIREILYTTSWDQEVLPIGVIRDRFLCILSIIVYVSTTRVSYIGYLSRYISHHRDDTTLPHTEKPEFLSGAPDALDFFAAFDRGQWMFCSVPLGPYMVYNRRLDSRQVLPFVPVGDSIGSAQVGRQTTVRCVKVDPSGGLQLPSWVRAFSFLLRPTTKSVLPADPGNILLISAVSRLFPLFDLGFYFVNEFPPIPTLRKRLPYLPAYLYLGRYLSRYLSMHCYIYAYRCITRQPRSSS